MSVNNGLIGVIALGSAYVAYRGDWDKIWNDKSQVEYITVLSLGLSSTLFPSSSKISDGLLKLYLTVKILQALKELNK